MIQIIPAIDLIEGRCVRLTQGDYGQKKIYDGEPTDLARQYADTGVQRIHLVDLDGAKAGEPRNLKVLEAIASAVSCELEWGGGIAHSEALQAVFDAGATHAIVGSVAALKPELFEQWLQRYGARMILGADVRDGRIAVRGWLEEAPLSIEDLVRRFLPLGLKESMSRTFPATGCSRALPQSFTSACNRPSPPSPSPFPAVFPPWRTSVLWTERAFRK